MPTLTDLKNAARLVRANPQAQAEAAWPTLPKAVRAAIQIVGDHPEALEALDRDERDAEAARTAEAKRNTALAEKVEKGLGARTAALVADYLALEQEAIRVAAEKLARTQLEIEVGLIDPRSFAHTGFRARLNVRLVDEARGNVAGSLPIPWDAKRRPGDVYQSAQATAAAATVDRESAARKAVDDVEKRLRAQLEADRTQRAMQLKAEARALADDERRRRAERKAEARAAGIPPARPGS